MNNRTKRRSRTRKVKAPGEQVPLSVNTHSSPIAFPDFSVPASAASANCMPALFSFERPANRETKLINVIKYLVDQL